MVWGIFCACPYLLLIFTLLSLFGQCPSAVWGLVHRNSDLKNPYVTISLFYCCHTSGFPNSTRKEVFTGGKIRG